MIRYAACRPDRLEIVLRDGLPVAHVALAAQLALRATCLARCPAEAASLASQPASAWRGLGFDPGEGLRGGPPPLLLAVALPEGDRRLVPWGDLLLWQGAVPGTWLRPLPEPRGLASRLAGRFARLRTLPDITPHAMPATAAGRHSMIGGTR